jgi:hypothetical protein
MNSGNRLGFSCGTVVGDLKHYRLPGWVVSPESAASKTIIRLDDSLEKCRRLASNKDVAFLFLRLRSANCSKSKKAHDPANLAEA